MSDDINNDIKNINDDVKIAKISRQMPVNAVIFGKVERDLSILDKFTGILRCHLRGCGKF